SFIELVAAADSVIREKEKTRIAEWPNAEIRHAVDVAVREREPNRASIRKPPVGARDVAEREKIVALERALAGAGESERHTARVFPCPPPHPDLPVGDVSHVTVDRLFVVPHGEAESLARRESPLIHAVRPRVRVRPEEREFRPLEESPLRRV